MVCSTPFFIFDRSTVHPVGLTALLNANAVKSRILRVKTKEIQVIRPHLHLAQVQVFAIFALRNVRRIGV